MVMPGTFDSLIFWKEFRKKGLEDVVVAETNTLPYATRLQGPGSTLIMSILNPLKVEMCIRDRDIGVHLQSSARITLYHKGTAAVIFH